MSAEQAPNWEDLHKKAKASADAGFDEDFDNATKDTAGKPGSTEDAEKKTGGDAKAKEEAENEKRKADTQETERKLWEKKKRELDNEISVERKRIKKMFENYKNLADANSWKTAFKALDKGGINKANRKILTESHVDNFVSCIEEIRKLAGDVSRVCGLFKSEGYFELDPTGGGKVDKDLDSYVRMHRTDRRDRTLLQINMRDNMQGRFNDVLTKQEKLFAERIEALENERKAWEETNKAEGQSGEKPEDSDEKDAADEKKEGAAGGQTEQEKQGGEQENSQEKETNESEQTNEEQAQNKEKETDPLKDALDEARKMYAETEYADRTAYAEIKKFSGFKLSEKEEQKESGNIAAVRERYERALKAYMNDQVAKLEAGGLQGEPLQAEMKKLFTYYNVTAAHELYNARTEAKIAAKTNMDGKSKLEKGWDTVSVNMTKAANWYNKEVPLWVKGGLAVGSFVAGAGAFTAGKRMFGAFMMATTGGIQLDAAAQFVDRRMGKKAGTKNIKEATDEKGKVDFEKFKGFLDKEIDNIDNKLNKFVLRSYINKVVAVGFAAFFGTMAFSQLAHALGGADVVPASVPNGAELPKIPKTGIFANMSTEHPGHVAAPITESMNQPGGAPIDFAKESAAAAHGTNPVSFQEALHTPAPADTLTIEKGSSIEMTLKHYLQEHGVKNPGVKAHKMYIDYMRQYIEENKEHLAKTGKLHEYQEMLKTGRVNIPPGAKLIVDKDGLLQNIEGKMSLLHGHHVGLHHGTNLSGNTPTPVAMPHDMPTPEPPPDVSGDIAGVKNEIYSNIQETQAHQAAVQAGIDEESYAVERAAADHVDRFHDAWKGNPELLDNLKEQYGADDKLLHKLFGEASRFDDANGIRTNTLYMKEVVFGNSNKAFDAWRNVRMEDIMNSSEHQKEFLKSLPDKEHRDAFKTLVKMSPAKSGDTVGKWLVRTVIRIPQMAPGK